MKRVLLTQASPPETLADTTAFCPPSISGKVGVIVATPSTHAVAVDSFIRLCLLLAGEPLPAVALCLPSDALPISPSMALPDCRPHLATETQSICTRRRATSTQSLAAYMRHVQSPS